MPPRICKSIKTESNRLAFIAPFIHDMLCHVYGLIIAVVLTPVHGVHSTRNALFGGRKCTVSGQLFDLAISCSSTRQIALFKKQAATMSVDKWNAMKSKNSEIYDLVGIGFGPSNLALAIALEECDARERPRAIFLEQKPAFAWHPHMLLTGTVMQISFLKDLVTQRNPESRFTFINYLKSRDRLSDFINLKSFYPTRVEFNDYMAWVAEQLKNCIQYSCSVTSVNASTISPKQLVDVKYYDQLSGKNRRILARNIGTTRDSRRQISTKPT